MGIFSRAIPTELPKLLEAVAKELPWKVAADGAAAIPFEATKARRASKLLEALEPEYFATRGPAIDVFKPNAASKYFAEVGVRGSRELEAATDLRTALGVTDPALLAEVNKAHGLNARIPAEDYAGNRIGKTAAAVPEEAAAAETAGETSHMPSGAELIKRGDQKAGRQI